MNKSEQPLLTQLKHKAAKSKHQSTTQNNTSVNTNKSNHSKSKQQQIIKQTNPYSTTYNPKYNITKQKAHPSRKTQTHLPNVNENNQIKRRTHDNSPAN